MAGWRGVRHLREQRHVEERVHYLAQHDILSGALNRASFGEALERAAWRHGQDGGAFAVLCIDLDRFKEVNDAFGHAAGDDVLRSVTAAPARTGAPRRPDRPPRRRRVRGAAGRRSGPADVARLAQRIVEAAGRAARHRTAASCSCAASVGAAVYGTDASTVPELLHKADLALYRAKSEGRGGFSFYDAALDRQLQSQRDLVRDLRQAIADEALTLHYQPQYDTDGAIAGRLRGAAALDAPDTRQRAARRLHRRGREQRPDRAARPLGAAARLPRGGRLAASRWRCRSTCRRRSSAATT